MLPLAALQVPFAVLLARNFIDGVPNELFEAAKIDGANTVRTFWYLVVPLTRAPSPRPSSSSRCWRAGTTTCCRSSSCRTRRPRR
ncbi:MAG: ABC transporter permease subunit [Galbitalea sp.]